MGLAAFAEFWDMDLVLFQVFNPVLAGIGAAEGNNDELAIGGHGDETWCTCQISGLFLRLEIFTMVVKTGHILPLRYRRVLILFHIWTIACWDLWTTITGALQVIPCRIIVIWPVGSGCKL